MHLPHRLKNRDKLLEGEIVAAVLWVRLAIVDVTEHAADHGPPVTHPMRVKNDVEIVAHFQGCVHICAAGFEPLLLRHSLEFADSALSARPASHSSIISCGTAFSAIIEKLLQTESF